MDMCQRVTTLFWLLLLRSPASSGTDVVCYCNDGDGCNTHNNTCNGSRNCQASVHTTTSGGYKLVQHCSHIGIFPCPITTFCCTSDYCNMCPDVKTFHLPYGILSQLRFPPTCNITFTDPTPTTNSLVTTIPGRPDDIRWLIVVISIATVAAIVVVIAVVFIVLLLWKRRKQRSSEIGSIGHPEVIGDGGDSSRCSDGKMMKLKTLTQSIKHKIRIARGAYGEVHLVDFEGRDVALKVMQNMKRTVWEREKRIYETDMLRHPNILGFIASDINQTIINVELWLMFDYHPHGSLLNYLTDHTLSSNECITFLHSISMGLAYLHKHVQTSLDSVKYIIAHRDIKTGNILVKNDMTCCIGDFGLSVNEIDFKSGNEIPSLELGTKRYLAPEILSESIQSEILHSHVMTDIYSFALVMWEVAQRCQWKDCQEVSPYEVAFSSIVPDNPSIEEMKKIVVVDEQRPWLDPSWKNSEGSLVSSLMEKSWNANPASRISACNIENHLNFAKKTIALDNSTVHTFNNL